ncbi:TonB-dependent receptor plug domain-containing protein [Maribacter chungangensis]|uniref:TonB-dependent receptor plug domain-containing protein n=1 Tax=Maribacter chungangensis TaxID=1069117 RepID=A0ABW3B360_9FLAO
MKYTKPSHCFNSVVYLWLFMFCFFAGSTSFAQEMAEPEAAVLPTEKVYLHVDKSFYAAGEDIWFKAYLLDGASNRPETMSEILYVELIAPDDNILATKTIKTTNGTGHGDFKLPPQSESGTYTIRSYTNYMRNFSEEMFFHKSIVVNSTKTSEGMVPAASKGTTSTKRSLQFFPEGGYMVNGLVNNVAFKVLDGQGKGTEVSGTIKDDTGRTITKFATSHLGMGLLHFIPTANRSYSAYVEDKKEPFAVALPEALEDGVLMTVSYQHDYYKIELRATNSVDFSDYVLVVKQQRDPILEVAVPSQQNERTAVIKLSKNILKQGVAQLTLLDQIARPVAERLIFNENDVIANPIDIQTGKTEYGNKERVLLEIEVDPTLVKNAAANSMSLAVTHSAVSQLPIAGMDIKTYLLLDSELRGTIENPGYYFNSKDVERKKNLDLLMRTQGWRQYVLQGEGAKTGLDFAPETGIPMAGKIVHALDRKKILAGSVLLTSSNQQEMAQHTAQTDTEGNFKFNNLDFRDTTDVLLSARVAYVKEGKKGKYTTDYKIVLTPTAPPEFDNGSTDSGPLMPLVGDEREAQELSNTFLLETGNTIQLDEALISAEEIEEKSEKQLNYERKRQSALYKEPSQTVDFNDIVAMPNLNPLYALQGRIAGLEVRLENDNRISLNMRGRSSAQPLILLDGLPIDPNGFFLQPEDIDFIDVIKGPRAGIYGLRAGGGVIAIYTKDGLEPLSGKTKGIGSIRMQHPGYNYARKFYEPDYGNTVQAVHKVDKRTTLLWQPYISFNNDGKAYISFYTGDIEGDYNLTLEGITSEGLPLHSSARVTVVSNL